jgi:beta-glucosidase
MAVRDVQSGNVDHQVLYGDYNPSGKLPMTFPRNVGQLPMYYNHKIQEDQ